MDVSVFGTGYVGLIQAAALADVGHRVLCADIDPNKIKQLQQAVRNLSIWWSVAYHKQEWLGGNAGANGL